MSTPRKFRLRVKPNPSKTPGSLKRRLSNPNNTAEAKVARYRINSKEEQLQQAVEMIIEKYRFVIL